MAKRMMPFEREFIHGFAAALGTLARDHDRPSMAVDIMKCHGITLSRLRTAKVDEFDLKPLAKEWRQSQ